MQCTVCGMLLLQLNSSGACQHLPDFLMRSMQPLLLFESLPCMPPLLAPLQATST